MAALAWAAASYLCLTLNDWLALLHAGRRLPYRVAAITSFTALAFGHNVGFAALSSGAIRYRNYSKAGLSEGDVGRVVVFCGTTIFLGMFVLGDVALFAKPDLAARLTGLSTRTVTALGIGLAGLPLIYLGLSWRVRQPLRLWHWSIALPSFPIALGQVAVGTINFLCVAACLHASVSAVADVAYFEVLSAFILANAATIITHAPGGLGVIETVVLLLLGKPELIGPILVFRFVYFLVPLALGAALFTLTETHRGFIPQQRAEAQRAPRADASSGAHARTGMPG